jgi:hypothetical protein
VKPEVGDIYELYSEEGLHWLLTGISINSSLFIMLPEVGSYDAVDR